MLLRVSTTLIGAQESLLATRFPADTISTTSQHHMTDLFDLDVDYYEHPELDHSTLCMHEYAHRPNQEHEAICHTHVLNILSKGYDCGHGNAFCVNVKQSPKGGWIR